MVVWCFNMCFLELNNMYGLEIGMCVFNYISILIFMICVGVFMWFYVYCVISVNFFFFLCVKKLFIFVIILSVICDCY